MSKRKLSKYCRKLVSCVTYDESFNIVSTFVVCTLKIKTFPSDEPTAMY